MQQIYLIGKNPNITDQKSQPMKSGLIQAAGTWGKHFEIYQTKNTDNLITLKLRLQYWETLKLYRKTLRTKRKQHEQHQRDLTEESIDSNNFWQKWHSFSKPHKEELAIQNGEM